MNIHICYVFPFTAIAAALLVVFGPVLAVESEAVVRLIQF